MNLTKYFVYILKCSDDSLYTGITNNILLRMKAHKNGKGSKFVRSRLPFKLIYKEVYNNKTEALKREFQIKKLNRTNKLKLINQ